MGITRSSVVAIYCLLAGLTLAPLSQARDGNPEGECHPPLPGDDHGPQGAAHGPTGAAPDFRPGPPGADRVHPGPGFGSPPPPWLRPVHLSEPQQDRVFAITHEAEPLLREQFKAVRASREALHRASLRPGSDATQLRSLADAVGRADAEFAVLTAQTDQKLLLVLTEDQQKLLQDCAPHPRH
jgi:Spy/CpxP family protein refolding chaperone